MVGPDFIGISAQKNSGAPTGWPKAAVKDLCRFCGWSNDERAGTPLAPCFRAPLKISATSFADIFPVPHLRFSVLTTGPLAFCSRAILFFGFDLATFIRARIPPFARRAGCIGISAGGISAGLLMPSRFRIPPLRLGAILRRTNCGANYVEDCVDLFELKSLSQNGGVMCFHLRIFCWSDPKERLSNHNHSHETCFWKSFKHNYYTH